MTASHPLKIILELHFHHLVFHHYNGLPYWGLPGDVSNNFKKRKAVLVW